MHEIKDIRGIRLPSHREENVNSDAEEGETRVRWTSWIEEDKKETNKKDRWESEKGRGRGGGVNRGILLKYVKTVIKIEKSHSRLSEEIVQSFKNLKLRRTRKYEELKENREERANEGEGPVGGGWVGERTPDRKIAESDGRRDVQELWERIEIVTVEILKFPPSAEEILLWRSTPSPERTVSRDRSTPPPGTLASSFLFQDFFRAFFVRFFSPLFLFSDSSSRERKRKGWE